jgi:hypothetical protein
MNSPAPAKPVWPTYLAKIGMVNPGEGRWDPSRCVYEVDTPNAFTQAAGYLKYTRSAGGPIYFRGQRSLHDTVFASLHRLPTGLPKGGAGITNSNKVMNSFLAQIATSKFRGFIRGTPEHAIEPLLQHYFMNTRYIDVVDNPWIALWFATRRLVFRRGRYAHYTTRNFHDERDKHAYVLLIQPGAHKPHATQVGVWVTPKAEVIDLRVACPSLYLRPHAQHGLLLRRTGYDNGRDADFAPLVVGILTVRIDRALEWLGEGHLLSARHLFPPPSCDDGYRILLESFPDPDNILGCIAHVNA